MKFERHLNTEPHQIKHGPLCSVYVGPLAYRKFVVPVSMNLNRGRVAAYCHNRGELARLF